MKTKLTCVAGCLCLAVALWFGSGISGGGYSRKSPMALNGRVTKPYPRDRDPRMEKRAKNPREEFEAARKRGLTEEEVRVIVEDFLEMGITFENHQDISDEDYLEMGNKARDWYQDALVEGFSLNQIQELVLIKMLREIGKKDAVSFSESRARFRNLSKKMEADELGLEAYGFALELSAGLAGNFGLWGKNLFPQNLIELSETHKQLVGYQDDSGEWIWVDGRERTFDFGTTESYGDLDDPFADGASVMGMAGQIFPLSMWQVERLGDFADEAVSPHTPKTKSGGDLDRVKFLTRPQLKTLLLFNPAMAGELMKELGE